MLSFIKIQLKSCNRHGQIDCVACSRHTS